MTMHSPSDTCRNTRFFPGGNEWFKNANVSIWTIILKTKIQNEAINEELQNVLHFERLKECCWEVSVIKSICQIFCNRLRCCKFAQSNVGISSKKNLRSFAYKISGKIALKKTYFALRLANSHQNCGSLRNFFQNFLA